MLPPSDFARSVLNTVDREVRDVYPQPVEHYELNPKGGYTFVTLPRIVTPYRDSVDGTRDRVTYQKLVAR